MLAAVLNSQDFYGPRPALAAVLEWEERQNAARTAFDQARFLDALEQYRAALAAAETAGASPAVRGRLLNGIGASLLRMSDYRAALAAFLQALPLAAKDADPERQIIVESNIASAYLFQGDRENARRLYQRALGHLHERSPLQNSASRVKPLILANLGAIEWRERRYRRALEYELAALAASPPEAGRAGLAPIYELLGLAHLELRNYGAARQAFEESLGLRQGEGDAARSRLYLGRTDLASGRPQEAVKQFVHAVALAQEHGDRAALWQALYWRALGYRESGNVPAAAADLAASAAVLESIRVDLVPTDGLLVQFEAEHRDVFEAWADLLCETAAAAGDTVAAAAFHAVESGRAYGLRALVARRPEPPGTGVPTLWRQYQDRLRRLERVRAQARAAGDTAPWLARASEEEAALRDLEARLRLEEPSLSSSVFAPPLTLTETQALLGASDLLLSFYLRPRTAWVWAVTSRQTRCYRLPPPSTWTPDVRRFVSALAEGGDAKRTGQRLYRALLAPVDRALLSKPHWIVAGDGETALIPFAALPAASGRYLVEERTLSYAPAASVLPQLRQRDLSVYGRNFLGLADPILNTADPRLVQPRPSAGEKMLPRLASSAGEVQACAKLFGDAGSTVLTGAAASESELRRQAAAGYRFWHLTSHIVVDAERPNTSFIALSLPDKLTVLDVLSLPARAEMVALNGCESGGGKQLAGTGVLGLTRAFLAAGAVSVLATRWPLPDESGALVRVLYRNLVSSASCHSNRAEALRQAQLEMLRAGDWRAEPRYWAAYFLSGWPGADGCPDPPASGNGRHG